MVFLSGITNNNVDEEDNGPLIRKRLTSKERDLAVKNASSYLKSNKLDLRQKPASPDARASRIESIDIR